MSFVRSAIKKWLCSRNIVLSRPPGQFDVAPIKLAQIKQRGLDIRFAIDGGAAKGSWTRELKAVYPNAQILCIDPREDVQRSLSALAAELPGIHIARALLSARGGDVVEFHEHAEQSSILELGTGKPFGQSVQIKTTTLDDLVAEMHLPFPDLIKLDLQGAELEALKGASRCLSAVKAVLLEISFLPIMDGGPLLAETVQFMKERGFCCYDIFALWHRPLDGAMAQGDFLFVPDASPLLADKRWSAQGAF
jgi:FkbM family methyltransferase